MTAFRFEVYAFDDGLALVVMEVDVFELQFAGVHDDVFGTFLVVHTGLGFKELKQALGIDQRAGDMSIAIGENLKWRHYRMPVHDQGNEVTDWLPPSYGLRHTEDTGAGKAESRQEVLRGMATN
jgi:hypothetical protein